ncbi:MAG: ankyrin repeat domain-containing protein [Puniceicoccales bacterium]|nr:ankyrin repeat domain-containing protein [Puniceicoccales bacterium]
MDEFESSDSEEMFNGIPDGSIVPIAPSEEANRSDENEGSSHQIFTNPLRTPPLVDLSSLYLVLIDDETIDFAMGKDPHWESFRKSLRLLHRYLLNIPGEEFLDEENWRNRCGTKLFPTAKRLKERFTIPQLLRMNIPIERLLEIEYLRTLLKSREFTSGEIFLLDKAIEALDCSPEQRLLNAIGSANEDPEEAFETVKLIIETEDVDVNLPYKGFQPREASFLHKAAEVELDDGLEIVRLLVDNGANIDIPNEGETALYPAIIKRNIEVVKLLIDRGANVNIRNENGWTPLHLTMLLRDFEIARLLLAAGANPNIRNNKGETPFDMAMKERAYISDKTKKRQFDEALNELHLQTS